MASRDDHHIHRFITNQSLLHAEFSNLSTSFHLPFYVYYPHSKAAFLSGKTSACLRSIQKYLIGNAIVAGRIGRKYEAAFHIGESNWSADAHQCIPEHRPWPGRRCDRCLRFDYACSANKTKREERHPRHGVTPIPIVQNTEAHW